MRLRSVVMAVAVAAACLGPVVQTATATVNAPPACPPNVWIEDLPATPKVYETNLVMKFTVVKADGAGCPGLPSVHFHTQQLPFSMTTTIEGVDYLPDSGIISLPSGSGKATITIQLIQDDIPNGPKEMDEQLQVCLDSPVNVKIVKSCGIGVVSTPWCVRPLPPETCQTCQFQIDLPEPVQHPVRLTYRTHDGTARAGEDYVAIPDARLEIPEGGRSAVIGVDILPGSGHDGEEWFVLEVTAAWDDEHVETHRQIVTISP